jgi:hypothetical protein
MRTFFAVSSALFFVGCGSTGIPGGPSACQQGSAAFAVGLLGDATRGAMAPPFASGGLLYVAQGASNAPLRTSIVSFQPSSRQVTEIARYDGEDVLLDVRNGAMLVYQSTAGLATGTILYRDDVREVTLASGSAWPLVSLDGAHLVDRNRAVWVAGDAVYVFDGSATHAISEGLMSNSAPYLDGDRVAWVAFDGHDTEIYLWSAGVREQLTDNGVEDFSPALSGTRLFWISNGAAMMRELSGGEARVLDPGPCSAPAAYGGRAVFACGGSGQVIDAGAPRIVYFDGRTTIEVPTLGGFARSPRLYGERIAWVEYPSLSALCNPPQNGSVVFWSGVAGSPAERVAAIGTACLCCNAYWPPPALVFDGSLLAWNYGVADSAAAPSPSQTGYALISDTGGCPAP